MRKGKKTINTEPHTSNSTRRETHALGKSSARRDPSNHLQVIKDFFHKNRRMPSYGELADLLNFKSKFAAQYVVQKLLEAGLISKDGTGRLLPGKSFYPLKVLGTIAAGSLPAEEENADTISLDDWLIENKEASFMLKVTGDSMVDAGIMPGDLVILERGRQPKNGDIVVAEIDRKWTLKYFERTPVKTGRTDPKDPPDPQDPTDPGDRPGPHLTRLEPPNGINKLTQPATIRLIAANKKYPPFVPTEELRIAGVVVAAIRKYTSKR